MTKDKVLALLQDLESDTIERTTSIREDKLGPVICAFANDYANRKRSGYILLGVNDNGSLAGMRWRDEQLQQIGNIKANGRILPPPSLVVHPVIPFDEGEVVVVEVLPSSYPPVRFDGRCWIRVGPRQAIATVEEEKTLTERRASYAKSFDLAPALGASMEDISLELFRTSYLPLAIDKDTLSQNNRSPESQLASLRFYDLKNNCPTNGGILVFGLNPEFFIPGAYIQYLKFSGDDTTSKLLFEKKFSGALITELKNLDDFIRANLIKTRPIRSNSFREEEISNYPFWALRELTMNSIMHRNYESNAPIYFYEFNNRIEIINPGGLFGQVTKENFPNASDYRNIVLAEALKILGYVNKFNYGVRRAIHELKINGNGEPEFDLDHQTTFKVSIPINKNWL
ncbi:MAG: putative DNA binding domain-containing protein [Cyclobacteriaceae bacterium]|nr:putative DNA binding domain-containing protein [Cyclobacteriaceae bacterium]MDW8331227.1 ATP-binding protein [Cyclobacteriaceae bacterium]